MSKKVLLGLILVLGGCVPSLHPLYTDKDLTFDPALLGEWTPGEGKGSWAFTQKGEKKYDLVCTDNSGKRGRFQVCMLKIEGRTFLDLFPIDADLKQNDFFKLHVLGAHTFMLVKQITPKLQMAILNPEWTHEYLRDHPDELRHERTDDRLVLTAQPKELQAFVLKHEKEAFSGLDDMIRLRQEARAEDAVRGRQ